VLALAALVVALPAPNEAWSEFNDARLAYTLSLPPGWRATVWHRATIVTSVPVADRFANPERIRLPRGGAYVRILDYGRIRGAVPPRPRQIALGRKETHACGYGEGYLLGFRDRGRVIQAFVKLGPGTSAGATVAVLNSLRVTK
jgi:hypothetical protein